MQTPPLLSEHPPALQVVLAVVVPAVYGAVTGIFLGTSEAIYLALSAIGILGAVGAGFDHRGARSGAVRGVMAGLIFGASILIAHELTGNEAKAELPEPAILLLLVTTLPAILLAAFGGTLRSRVEERSQRAR